MASRVLRPRSDNLNYYIPHPDQVTASNSRKIQPPQPTKSRITKPHSAPRLPHKQRTSSTNIQSSLPNTPYFSPLSHQHAPHVGQNRLPSCLMHADIIEPHQIFRLFFTEPILHLMVTNTNAYASVKRGNIPEPPCKPSASTPRSWTPICRGELMCWLGILVYMGLVRLPAVADFWRGEHDTLWPHHDFCQYMGQTRFEEIKRYFHISAPDAPKTSPEGHRLWHGKVDPLLDTLRTSSQQYRIPQSNVTVDEAMMRFLGRSVDICKMPGKPIEVGYKFHCLADRGYVWNFWPHSGTKNGYDPLPPIAVRPTPGGLTPTGAMVLYLAKQLPYTTMAFNIFTDNYYTTVALLQQLRAIGIGGCGTTRKTGAGYPESLKVPEKAQTRVEYHYSTGAIAGGVAVLLWFDNAPVSLMTTIHRLKGRSSQVTKARKRPTRSNPSAASQVFRTASQLLLDIPACVDDYNHNKVGVDVADQYRSYYSVQLVTQRNWFPIFFWALETALINSFIIYSDIPSCSKITHKDFRMQVAWELIMQGKRRKSHHQTASTTPHHPSTTTPQASHLPISVPKEERHICEQCRLQSITVRESGVPGSQSSLLPKSCWKCSSCNIFLCLNSSRNCFFIYHRSL